MKQILNLSLPFAVRPTKARDDSCFGHLSIEDTKKYRTLPKSSQLLFFYNSKVKCLGTNSSVKYPRFVKVDDWAPSQLTTVIDFDKVGSNAEGIQRAFEKYSLDFGNRPLMFTSASGNGIHVMTIIDNETDKRHMYKTIQTHIIDTYFKEFKHLVDPVSYSHTQGFYHSHIVNDMVDQALLNLTKTTQKGVGYWSEALELSDVDIVNLIGLSDAEYADIEEDKLSIEVSWLGRYLKSTTEGLLNESMLIRRFCGNLAEIIRRGHILKVKNTLQRESREKSKVWRLLQSTIGQDICGDAGLSEIYQELEPLNQGRGVGGCQSEDGGSPGNDREPGVSRSGSSSDGPGGCSGLWDGIDSRLRLYQSISPIAVFPFVQALQSTIQGRGISLKELGRSVSTVILRGYVDGSQDSEEQDFSVFLGIVRQAVAECPGLEGDFGASYQRCYEWLRYAARYLADTKNATRWLRQFAQETARTFRLCAKAQGHEVGRFSLHKISRRGVDLHSVVKWTDTFNCNIFGDKRKQQIATKLFNNTEKIEQGTYNLICYLYSMYPKIEKGEYIHIGLKDFVEMYQVNINQASIIKDVVMPQLMIMSRAHIPKISRTGYLINLRILQTFRASSRSAVSSPEQLAMMLGNGNTWAAICKYATVTFHRFGLQHSMNLWTEAFQIASVNDFRARVRDIQRYLSHISQRAEKVVVNYR